VDNFGFSKIQLPILKISLIAQALEVAAEGLAKDHVESLVGQQIRSYKILSLLGAAWCVWPNVQVLLEAGADIHAKDKDGKTALMIAEERGHSEIVELLKQAGATE